MKYQFTKGNQINKGRIPWNKGIKHPTSTRTSFLANCLTCQKVFRTYKCRIEIGSGKYCSRRCKSLGPTNPIKGSTHHFWQGGVSRAYRTGYGSQKYLDWRTLVFERDDFTCKSCGKKGVYLHAHHVKQFAFFPELRFDINNGLTLCKECHKQTDTYGHKGRKLILV